MLNQLLSLLFNKNDPKKAIKSRLDDHWQSWLLPITPEKPVGEDLTYNDNFQELKEEVTKLSGVDYPLIISSSEAILKQGSKDIRVATYYCFARLQLDGAEGFADGVELIAGLLERFGGDIYPSRNTIRKNSIEWLANMRFTDKLYQLRPLTQETVTRIIAALNLIEQSSQTIFIDKSQAEGEAKNITPDLSGLLRFFVTNLNESPKIKRSEPVPIIEQAAPMVSSGEESAAIRSQRDLLEQARRMALFLRERPQGYLAAGRCLRTLRWDTIEDLPPSDTRGKTRLAAPRTELRQHISRLAISQQWPELYERVEAAFMEGANHFWLDLQRYAVLALQKMGSQHQQWADIYLTDIGLMLERLKGVERLRFENGTAFADDETLSWIALSATIHRVGDETHFEPMPIESDNDWPEMEFQAKELAQKESLTSAFNWLQGLPMLSSPKQRFLLTYTQARVAEQVGQIEVALNLLQSLDKQQQRITFTQWEPDLLFDMKARLYKLLTMRYQVKESSRVELKPMIEQLSTELMQLDAARALAVIS